MEVLYCDLQLKSTRILSLFSKLVFQNVQLHFKKIFYQKITQTDFF